MNALFGRFLAFFLALSLFLPNPALALRVQNGGLEERTPTVRAIENSLFAGMEEITNDFSSPRAFLREYPSMKSFGQDFIESHWSDIQRLWKWMQHDEETAYLFFGDLGVIGRKFPPAWIRKHWDLLLRARKKEGPYGYDGFFRKIVLLSRIYSRNWLSAYLNRRVRLNLTKRFGQGANEFFENIELYDDQELDFVASHWKALNRLRLAGASGDLILERQFGKPWVAEHMPGIVRLGEELGPQAEPVFTKLASNVLDAFGKTWINTHWDQLQKLKAGLVVLPALKEKFGIRWVNNNLGRLSELYQRESILMEYFDRMVYFPSPDHAREYLHQSQARPPSHGEPTEEILSSLDLPFLDRGGAKRFYLEFRENVFRPFLRKVLLPEAYAYFLDRYELSLDEAALNLIMHGRGGRIEIVRRKIGEQVLSGMAVRLLDQGSGIEDPGRLFIQSVMANNRDALLPMSFEVGSGLGFQHTVTRSDKVTVDSLGTKWEATPSSWEFKKIGPGEWARGASVTLFYNDLGPIPGINPWKIFYQAGLEEKETVERAIAQDQLGQWISRAEGGSVAVVEVNLKSQIPHLYLHKGLTRPTLPDGIQLEELSNDLQTAVADWLERMSPTSADLIVLNNHLDGVQETPGLWLPDVSPRPSAVRMSPSTSSELFAGDSISATNNLRAMAALSLSTRDVLNMDVNSITFVELHGKIYAVITSA